MRRLMTVRRKISKNHALLFYEKGRVSSTSRLVELVEHCGNPGAFCAPANILPEHSRPHEILARL